MKRLKKLFVKAIVVCLIMNVCCGCSTVPKQDTTVATETEVTAPVVSAETMQSNEPTAPDATLAGEVRVQDEVYDPDAIGVPDLPQPNDDSGNQGSGGHEATEPTGEPDDTEEEELTPGTHEDGQDVAVSSSGRDTETDTLDDLLIYEIFYRNSYLWETLHYTYDDSGRLLTREQMGLPDTEPYYIRSYTYDFDGRLQGWTCTDGSYLEYYPGTDYVKKWRDFDGSFREYDEQGRLLHEYYPKYMDHYIYSYDEQNRVIEENFYRGDEYATNGPNPGRTVYTYSEDGLHATTKEYWNGEWTETYAGFNEEMDFDTDGNLLYRHRASQSGNHDGEERYEYDDAGRKIYHGSFAGDMINFETYWEYEGDSLKEERYHNGDGVLITTYDLDQDGKILSVEKYTKDLKYDVILNDYISKRNEYDERGNISKEYTYESNTEDGEFETLTIYVYAYDPDPYEKMPETY